MSDHQRDAPRANILVVDDTFLNLDWKLFGLKISFDYILHIVLIATVVINLGQCMIRLKRYSELLNSKKTRDQ